MMLTESKEDWGKKSRMVGVGCRNCGYSLLSRSLMHAGTRNTPSHLYVSTYQKVNLYANELKQTDTKMHFLNLQGRVEHSAFPSMSMVENCFSDVYK